MQRNYMTQAIFPMSDILYLFSSIRYFCSMNRHTYLRWMAIELVLSIGLNT